MSMDIGCVWYAVTCAQMRELDRRASEEFGIPSLILMERAGRAGFEAAVEILDAPDLTTKMVFVVVGPGNNGGDGLVVARYLRDRGVAVQIFCFGDRITAKGDALTNLVIAEKIGIEIEYTQSAELLRELIQNCECDLVVDALLGTGIRGDVKSPFDEVIRAINTACAPVLSLDIPSGIDADSGAICGVAVKAGSTITFAYPKIGLLTYAGVAHVGKLIVADIGIPERAQRDTDRFVYRLGAWTTRSFLPSRSADMHKGDCGHVAIVAGSVGMTGAAALAAQGALRIGTGLVTLAVPESLNDIMEVKLTEAMTIPVPEGKARAFGMASLDKVLEIIHQSDSAVIGPGLGRDEDTVEFTLELLKKLHKPAIVDADALYAVSTNLKVLKKCKAPLVITPHPGEMARLLGTTVAEVQSNRLEVARSFSREHGVTVVLKGAGTIVAEPNGNAYINTTGTPGMATGGTGDVLSGMIGGLLAQKLDGRSSSTSAVYLHGLAGEIAARKHGEASMIASDLADCIGDAILEVKSGSDERM